MELRQLETFCVLAEELHFGRTAERLFVSQSSVSQQLRRLESELGALLVHRSSRRVTLTPAGTVFLADVRQVLERLGQAARTVRAMDRGHHGSVRIGTNLAGSRLVVLPLLSAMRESAPGLTVTMRECGSPEQERALELGDLDLGVLYGPPVSDRLASRHIADVDIVGLMRPEHPLSSRDAIDLTEISRYPFTAGHKGGSTAIRQRIAMAVQMAGGTLGPERDEAFTAMYMDIAASDLIAFPSRERAEQGVASGLVLRELVPKPAPLQLHAAWDPTRNEPSVNSILEMIFQLAPI